MTMDRLTAKPATDERFHLGEGCRWDEVTGRLNWVDAFAGQLYEAEWTGTELANLSAVGIDGDLTSFAPLDDRSAGWIIAADQGFSLLSRDGQRTVLASPESGKDGRVRMNDGACDPVGRFWAGSMAYDAAPGAGSLYRFDGTRCDAMVHSVTISNGIGWSPDGRRMYYVDSAAGWVRRYDYDAADGTIGEPVTLADIDPELGVPDGLCVDQDGRIWVAIWGGSEVRRYTPDGDLLAVVSVGTSQPSSCALGGPDGRLLFITTARSDLPDTVLAAEPDAGRLFSVPVSVPGLPLQPYLGLAGA
jgi:sugar lactone lactonase YvrE